MLGLLVPAAAAVGLFILQGTILASLQLDLITPVVVYVALEADLGPALGFAIGLGFLADTMMGVFCGLGVALDVGVVLVARLLRGHLLLTGAVVRMGVVAACLLARGLLFLSLSALLGWPGPGLEALLVMVVQVAAGALLSLPLFALLDRAAEVFSLRQQPL